ncbi:MAG: type II toxin-antitoxin system VapC family toxin [Chloroflexi bacterium]|nr:type II toxin-antitoxin system VapC family toxin [Chloroflexota bacterium]
MSDHRVVLDSYALLAYFEAEKGATRVQETLRDAEAGKVSLLMSTVNWCEVYYSIWRAKGEQAAEQCALVMDQLPIALVDIDRQLAHIAARFKANYPIALGDCLAAALATARDANVLTGDPEFKKLEREVPVEWIE